MRRFRARSRWLVAYSAVPLGGLHRQYVRIYQPLGVCPAAASVTRFSWRPVLNLSDAGAGTAAMGSWHGTTSINAQLWLRILASDFTTLAHAPAGMSPMISLKPPWASVLRVFLRKFTLQRARMIASGLILPSPVMAFCGIAPFE